MIYAKKQRKKGIKIVLFRQFDILYSKKLYLQTKKHQVGPSTPYKEQLSRYCTLHLILYNNARKNKNTSLHQKTAPLSICAAKNIYFSKPGSFFATYAITL